MNEPLQVQSTYYSSNADSCSSAHLCTQQRLAVLLGSGVEIKSIRVATLKKRKSRQSDRKESQLLHVSVIQIVKAPRVFGGHSTCNKVPGEV